MNPIRSNSLDSRRWILSRELDADILDAVALTACTTICGVGAVGMMAAIDRDRDDKTEPKPKEMAAMKIGTQIYYTGDCANEPGVFYVSEVFPAGYFTLSERGWDGAGRIIRGVRPSQVGSQYEGHCDPRFVLLDAVEAWRAQRA